MAEHSFAHHAFEHLADEMLGEVLAGDLELRVDASIGIIENSSGEDLHPHTLLLSVLNHSKSTNLTMVLTSISTAITSVPWQLTVQPRGTATQRSCRSYISTLRLLSALEALYLHLTVKGSLEGRKLAQGTKLPRSPMQNWNPGTSQVLSIVRSQSPLERPYLSSALILPKVQSSCSPPNCPSSKSTGNCVQFSAELSSPNRRSTSNPFETALVSSRVLTQLQKRKVILRQVQVMLLLLSSFQWLRWSLSRGTYFEFTRAVSYYLMRVGPACPFSMDSRMLSSSLLSSGVENSMWNMLENVRVGTRSATHSMYPSLTVRFLVKYEGSKLPTARMFPVLFLLLQVMVKLKQVLAVSTPMVTLARYTSRKLSTWQWSLQQICGRTLVILKLAARVLSVQAFSQLGTSLLISLKRLGIISRLLRVGKDMQKRRCGQSQMLERAEIESSRRRGSFMIDNLLISEGNYWQPAYHSASLYTQPAYQYQFEILWQRMWQVVWRIAKQGDKDNGQWLLCKLGIKLLDPYLAIWLLGYRVAIYTSKVLY